MIFTEFLAYAESRHGDDFVDDMIFSAQLPSKGIYTAVGTYEFTELVTMLATYCQLTRQGLPPVLHAFGKYLVTTFHRKWPEIFAGYSGTISLLNQVQDHIHVEVMKLYPDAQLPHFDTISMEDDRIVMDYSSCRALADLAIGLIEGVADYYDERVAITTLPIENKPLAKVRFTIELQ